MKRPVTLIAAAAMAFGLPAMAAAAAELVILEQPGCVWCARFNSEIGPAWPNTDEGRRAPLRRVDITASWPTDLDFVARERMTPTFVLIDDGVEIGRIRGYPGDEFFWFLAGELLARLPAAGDS